MKIKNKRKSDKMKKYFWVLILTLTMMLTFSCYAAELVDESATAIINNEISIVYNNEIKSFFDVNGNSVSPITYNDTTYLPIRSISALFNIPVHWDGVNRKVLLGSGDVVESTVKTISTFNKGTNTNVELTVGKTLTIEYNGKEQSFANEKNNVVYPLLYNGTTYLPVRAISNMYGASVDWNEENKRVTLTSEDKVAQITDVIIKVASGNLYAEIKTDTPLKSYNEMLLGEGKVSAEPYLNMRASTSTSAEIIEKIPQDTIVTIKKLIIGEKSDKWYQVSYADKVGYVSADYVIVMSSKLVMDAQNTSLAKQISSQEINYGNIKSIRFGNQGNDINRIVLDLNDVTQYCVSQSKDGLTTYLALSDKFEVEEEIQKDYTLVASIGNQIYVPDVDQTSTEDKNNTSVEDTNDTTNSDESNESENKENNDDVNNEELTEEQKAKMVKVTGVLYSSSTDKTKINITGNYKYEKFLLENPNRLVIDIENALLQVDGPTEITTKNKNVKTIRFSQYAKDKVRVVFEFDKAVDYEIAQKTKGLEIKIDEPKYRNVEYTLKDDYAELILKDVQKKVFDVSETTRTNKITLTYASSKFDSGKSTLDINDNIIKNIEIKTNKIVITGAQKISYEMKQDGEDVIIKIFEKGKETSKKDTGDFIVLLDAGHGGTDPGACRGSSEAEKKLAENQEKTYTLPIMKRVQELLEDTDGIQVEVSRSKDVYMDREDRVDFILDNPDANMLVSVHINSHSTNKTNGLEVVYCNKTDEKEDYGITSKELALILLDCFKEELDINIRGLSSRNGEELWILEQNDTGAISKYTKEDRPVTNIPAVICELCFITNDSDFEKLVTDEFQENAAQAIYQGILEAKEQMEG